RRGAPGGCRACRTRGAVRAAPTDRGLAASRATPDLARLGGPAAPVATPCRGARRTRVLAQHSGRVRAAQRVAWSFTRDRRAARGVVPRLAARQDHGTPADFARWTRGARRNPGRAAAPLRCSGSAQRDLFVAL